MKIPVSSYWFLFAAAVLLSLIVTPFVRALALRARVAENSAQRPDAGPIPTLGGLAVLAALVGTIALAALIRPDIREIISPALVIWRWSICGVAMIAALGVVDDLIRVRPLTKIVFQLLAALLVVADGHGIGRVINPLTGQTFYLGWLAAPVTLLWIIGVTNAFNLIDGLDGLAAGIGFIAALTLAGIAALAEKPDIVLIALSLAGALGGFLYYNYSPASIFMGDSGSLFVGFMVAALYVRGAQQTEGVPLLTPILALAVPIADALLAILRRGFWSPADGRVSRLNISERLLAIFRRDREHIHHRLMSKGFKEAHAVLMLYGASLLSAAIAILTFQSSAARVIALALMLGAGVFAGVRKLR